MNLLFDYFLLNPFFCAQQLQIYNYSILFFPRLFFLVFFSSISRSQLNVLDDPAASIEPDRLTPLKFTSTHSSASFQDGVLVCVKQKYLASSENQNNVHILKFGEFDHNYGTLHMSRYALLTKFILPQ